MIRLGSGLILVVALYWTLLFLLQRRMLFPAPPLGHAPGLPAEVRSVWLQSPAGRTEALFLPPNTDAPVPAPLLLFAHGNAELADYWVVSFHEPRQWGMGVLLVEYPGYGRSGGSPSRTSIGAAFAAAFEWASTQPGIDPRRIIGYGRSLGGGAIGDLSRGRGGLAALILESCFTRTTAFAWRVGAPPFLVRDRFDNLAALDHYGGPVLVLHGAQDEVIPVEHGRQLAARAGVPLQLLPCGHNDCPRPWGEIRGFLTEHLLLPQGS